MISEVPLVSYLDGTRRVVGLARVRTGGMVVEVQCVVKDSDFARLVRADHLGEMSFGAAPRLAKKCAPCIQGLCGETRHESMCVCCENEHEG